MKYKAMEFGRDCRFENRSCHLRHCSASRVAQSPVRPCDTVFSGQSPATPLLISLLIAALLFCNTGAWAGFGSDSGVGTSGAQFLKIGPGARPAGMGEAFSAMDRDIHALYYNPAGLARIPTAEIAGMHNQYFQGLNYEFAAAALPLGTLYAPGTGSEEGARPFGVLGIALYNLSVEDLERRTSDSDTSLGEFGASDFAYGLSYARPLGEKISLGATVKYVRQKIDTSKASAVAFDLGGLYLLESWPVSFGLGVRHLGTEPKFENSSDPLPTTVFTGVRY